MSFIDNPKLNKSTFYDYFKDNIIKEFLMAKQNENWFKIIFPSVKNFHFYKKINELSFCDKVIY